MLKENNKTWNSFPSLINRFAVYKDKTGPSYVISYNKRKRVIHSFNKIHL